MGAAARPLPPARLLSLPCEVIAQARGEGGNCDGAALPCEVLPESALLRALRRAARSTAEAAGGGASNAVAVAVPGALAELGAASDAQTGALAELGAASDAQVMQNLFPPVIGVQAKSG